MGIALIGGLCGGLAGSAQAKPVAPASFCAQYADAPICQSGQPACTFCHTTPPARNALGAQLEQQLLPGAPRPLSDEDFQQGLGGALMAIEMEDADGDGAPNLDEILAGTDPANATSLPTEAGCPVSSAANGGYDVCHYDPGYVHKKVYLDFCGGTLRYDQIQAFDLLEDQSTPIHEALDRCLDSEHWLGADGVLYRLAHKKIRPVQSIKSGEGAGDVPLGDYDDDYFLFVYTQIDGHDARELLTAEYFVAKEGPPTVYTPYTRSPIADVGARGVEVAQLVEPNKRAGMLTTRWNFALNTMFTPIPRTTAAQAYRAFLGMDIARMEGLVEIEGEPVDYDQKGVTEPECARCHSTLDPLTYPFTRYSGFNGGLPFSYVPGRMNNMAQSDSDPLRNTPEAGYLLGQPVADLLQWAQVAADSDAFAKALVMDYWMLLMGEAPRPTEQAEYDGLWRAFKNEHNYSVERMLHDLIETEAYGVP